MRFKPLAPLGAILSLALLSTGCADELDELDEITEAIGEEIEERVATSPLVGASPIDERGEARVDELLRVRGYTYLRLSTAEAGVWHVISGSPPELGARIRYRGYAELRGYRSPSLQREFDRLVFASARPQPAAPE